jgi:hypothetical protein
MLVTSLLLCALAPAPAWLLLVLTVLVLVRSALLLLLLLLGPAPLPEAGGVCGDDDDDGAAAAATLLLAPRGGRRRAPLPPLTACVGDGRAGVKRRCERWFNLDKIGAKQTRKGRGLKCLALAPLPTPDDLPPFRLPSSHRGYEATVELLFCSHSLLCYKDTAPCCCCCCSRA